MTTNIQNSVWTPVENLEKNCFGCGNENAHGLQMIFETNGTELRSTVQVPERFRGWSNLIHGGVLSTILDEVMGWTAILFTRKFMLTRKMNIEFQKPVRVDAVLTATARIKEQRSERRATVIAEIRDQQNDICVISEGEFALFTPEQFRRMRILSDSDLDALLQAHPELDEIK